MTRIEATPIATTAHLEQLIAAHAGPVAVADLSLGSWEPHALELQILGQLTGRELSPKLAAGAASASASLGDAMSAGIDQEARGNRSLLDAWQAAQRIGTALRRTQGAVVVIAPAFGIAWRREDRLLVDYLAREGPEAVPRFAAIVGSTCAWPDEWTVVVSHEHPEAKPAADAPIATSLPARLPGAIPPSVLARHGAAAARDVLVLSNGWAIVRPELRRAPAATPFSRGDVDAVLACGLRHGAAFALHHGPRAPGDCWLFCRAAWMHFDGGYRELAFLFIEAAQAAAPDDAARQTFECHRQSMLLASAGYVAAGAAPAPASDLPDTVRRFLWQTKGWGLAMSDQATEALPCLYQALSTTEPATPDVPHMFLLNITALAEVRCGHHAAAHALEKKIERQIVEQGLDNARLQFVNWMNLARLERYSQRLDEAERYYRLAFSTVEGARTEADSVNANLCMERIEAARGDPRAALLCWVRAAFHWIASDCPEALNWRIQSLILGRRVPAEVASLDEATRAVEALAEVMQVKLARACEECGLVLDADPSSVAAFAFVDSAPAGTTARGYVGGIGWAVIATDGDLRRPDYGPRHRALRAWLTAWARQHVDASAAADGYLVDRNLGTEMPQDEAQMRASAVACGVTRMTFDGRRLALDPRQRALVLQRRTLVRNPVVARIDTEAGRTLVQYRRYFAPHALSADECALLRASADEPNVGRLETRLVAAGWPTGQVARTIAGLQKHHVLRVLSDGEAGAAIDDGTDADNAENALRSLTAAL